MGVSGTGRPFMWQQPQDSKASSPFDPDEGPCGLSGDTAQLPAPGSLWGHTAMPKVVWLEVQVELTRACPKLPERAEEGPWVPLVLVQCPWHLPETVVEDVTNSLPMPTLHLSHPAVCLLSGREEAIPSPASNEKLLAGNIGI